MFSLMPAQAGRVRLTVQEPAGVARTAWPVTSGIPFAKGALIDPQAAALFDIDGAELPLQTETLSRWPDGSVRWLLLDFQVDLQPNQTKRFVLCYGPGTSRRGVEHPLRVTPRGTDILIDTGPARLTFSRDHFRLLDAAWLDADGDGAFSDGDRLTGPQGAGIVLRTPDGRTYRADLAEASCAVEESGPLRACLRFDGKHASSGDTRFSYVVRLHAFRGRPVVKLEYTFVNDCQDAVMTNVKSLELVFAAPQGAKVHYLLDGKPVSGGRLFQVDETRYLLDGKPAGRRAAGWAAVGGEGSGLAVGVREFWQNWPKSIEVGSGQLRVGICPEFAEGLYDGKPLIEENKLYYYLRGGVYTFKVGLARTHELWAALFRGEPDAAALGDFFRAAEEPLLATCEPGYVSATQALGDFPPADPEKYDGYDSWLSRALDAQLKRRIAEREFGMLNYGDWYGERTVNWGNLEYDLAHGLFLQYLRTGDRRFFLRAEQAARHHIDVDVVHAVNPLLKNPFGSPPVVGDIWLHSCNHTGGYYENAPLPVDRTYQMGHSQNFGHVWVGGDLEYYYLTGDRRAWDIGIQIADAMAGHCPTSYGTHIRNLGWPLILLLNA
jgi:hypothetical protein